MKWQGSVELMLFIAMVLAVWIGSYELLFPPTNKPNPTTDNEDDGQADRRGDSP